MKDQRSMTALEALEAAHRVALAPFAFQAACVLRETGILDLLVRSEHGETLPAIAAHAGLSTYATRVLVEAGVGVGLLAESTDEGRYTATKIGWFLENAAAVRANMDFSRDIAYAGLAQLGPSVESGRPVGLTAFGDWSNIYEGLASLPEHARRSWFAFDHHYSDAAFPAALDIVLGHRPGSVLDIGGNTGKAALALLARDPSLQITIVDLPGQLEVARNNLRAAARGEQVRFHAADMLDPEVALPKHHDAIWMSQFLDCFSEAQIESILRRCNPALASGGRLYVLEPFVDRQRNPTARFCLQMTSLYFCAIANGCSRIYESSTLVRLLHRAGFEVEAEHDDLGMGHTLLVCRVGAGGSET